MRPLLIRALVTVTAAMFAAVYVGLYVGWGDWRFPVCASRHLFDDPYTACALGVGPHGPHPLNPLTTVLIVYPFDRLLPGIWVAPVAVALMVGLLAWAVSGVKRWRLLTLLAAPLPLCVHWVQWPPLILAAWWLPWLWPVALLAKPHAALPIAALRWRQWPWGLPIVAAIGLLSLAIRPNWPREWLGSIGGYTGGPAIVQPWGPLLLLALLRWREEGARLLLLLAIVPLRGLYDLLLLCAVPHSPAGLLGVVVASWLALAANGWDGGIAGPGASFLWLAALASVLAPTARSGTAPATPR